MKRILAAGIALSCLSAVRLPAQALNWSTPAKYGTGEQSSVSMNSSGLVVEVHKSQTSNTLFYHVGKLNRSNGTVTWSGSHVITTQVKTARWPSVALTQNSNVIIVFDDGSLQLRYMTGTLNPTGSVDQLMNWVVTDTQYDTGRTPQISVNSSGTLVEVHQNNDNAGKLFYRYGYVDPNTSSPKITWTSGTQGIPYEIGSDPHISLDDAFTLVEVHKEKSGNNLHYRRGSASDNQLFFQESQLLPRTGQSSSVALTNFGLAVTLLDNSHTIYATAGYQSDADPAKIDWQPVQQVRDEAYFPAVTTDGDWIIAVWTRGPHAGFDLQYSAARVP
jgi:hypothetical protein